MALKSISGRLQFYLALTMVLLLGVSGFALLQIWTIDKTVETLDSKWLAGAHLLADIDDAVSEFSRSQRVLFFASEQAAIDVAGRSIESSINAVTYAKAAYISLMDSENERALFGRFESAWRTYLAEHRNWMQVDAARRWPESEHFRIATDAAYAAAHNAIQDLIDLHEEMGRAAGKTANRIVDRTGIILTAIAALGLALIGWIVVTIRNQISRPLASITQALSRLAAGDRGFVVPESKRADEIGEMAHAFEIFRQNMFALEEAHAAAEAAQQKAQALARHDALTGLANRRVFADELEKALARAQRGAAESAVLLLDLDRFKPVNDIYGHPAGDAVLCAIAERLKELVRKSDTIARLGGDEFAIITELTAGQAKSEAPMRLANRVIAAISAPIDIGETRVDVGTSIGIAHCPTDGADAETIIRAADIAMYRAKRDGGGAFRFFEQSMDVELRARAALEAEIRRAVADGEIRPHYQPLMELAEDRPIGFEILARWERPGKEPIGPERFVPIIEELGLSADFTLGMLRRACLDAQAWPAELVLSLNVAPNQLKDPLFPARLLAVLTETGFPPRRLEVEITETALITDLEVVRSILASLQSLGIKIALDDFGTGYSSLYHLRELHLDKIKIDRSFIQSMSANAESAKIVAAILNLAKGLALPATAEGIEDADTMARMVEGGCEFGQGFYFGKAMSPAEAIAWVRQHRPGMAQQLVA